MSIDANAPDSRSEKVSEGVAQIGRLVEVCAKSGLSIGDILLIFQTSTALVLQMNGLSVDQYVDDLLQCYYLHNKDKND